MKKRFSSIRFLFIRSHLNGWFITTVTILSILLTVYVLFSPEWLTAGSIFLFISLHIFLGIIISLYTGFTTSGNLKTKMDGISVVIKHFSNGIYGSRLNFVEESDEVTRIGDELNELGEKLGEQVKSLQRMADEKSELAKSAHKSAVIEERQRLARDLHDAVSQQLFALTMMSEAALKQFEKNPEKAKEQLTDVVKAGTQTQTEMRALLLHLRPVQLSGDSLPTGIQKLVNELKQKSRMKFQLALEPDLMLSETVEEHVFRIVQEALSNILRHANATTVKIEVFTRSRELFLHIRDNGKGFDIEEDSDKKASYGLKTMRERTEELGGRFTIRTNIDEGTYIDIRIPM
jgi:NarL family two-component system sensor histidine kinase LiaS